ncbi:uncharacterized protein LOC110924586 [Helianthus annuus]|uniref:uncharacterized protein LOC110924586 n=1 Tax=Helianthus annuus TaxID=4232 RepID=UPI000B902DF3|nr:uncharacterized protein LOC110924586 [Helianthus annuus]
MQGAFNLQPNPTQPVQPQPIPTQLFQQSEPDEDVEVVPETQPQKEKCKRRKGKQVVGEQPSKPKAKLWMPIEEEALAKAYIGNNQTGDDFWKAVLAKFLGLMDQGPYRDIDSVSSKWRKMNGFVNKFCDEYNKIYSSGRRSGMSDEDVFKKAMEMYKSNNGNTSFAHVRAWEILRTHPKWAPIPNEVEMAKRQRTSESGSFSAGGSDARCHINLDDDAEFDEEEYALHEAERPPGRDKSKKERTKEKEKKKVDLKMDEFMAQFKTYTEVSAQKAKAKERAVKEKSRVAGEKLREKIRLSDEKNLIVR